MKPPTVEQALRRLLDALGLVDPVSFDVDQAILDAEEALMQKALDDAAEKERAK